MGRFAISRIHQPVDNTRHRLSHGGVFVTLSDGRPATSNDATARERNNKLLALHQRASTPGAYLARRAQKQKSRHAQQRTAEQERQNLGPTELSHNLDDLEATRSFHLFHPSTCRCCSVSLVSAATHCLPCHSHIPVLCRRNGKKKFVEGLKDRMVDRKKWTFTPETLPRARDIGIVVRPLFQTGNTDSILMAPAFI